MEDLKEIIKRSAHSGHKGPMRRILKGECMKIISDYMQDREKPPTPEEFSQEINRHYPEECRKKDGGYQSSWEKAVAEAKMDLGRWQAWEGTKPFPYIPPEVEVEEKYSMN